MNTAGNIYYTCMYDIVFFICKKNPRLMDVQWWYNPVNYTYHETYGYWYKLKLKARLLDYFLLKNRIPNQIEGVIHCF